MGIFCWADIFIHPHVHLSMAYNLILLFFCRLGWWFINLHIFLHLSFFRTNHSFFVKNGLAILLSHTLHCKIATFNIFLFARSQYLIFLFFLWVFFITYFFFYVYSVWSFGLSYKHFVFFLLIQYSFPIVNKITILVLQRSQICFPFFLSKPFLFSCTSDLVFLFFQSPPLHFTLVLPMFSGFVCFSLEFII